MVGFSKHKIYFIAAIGILSIGWGWLNNSPPKVELEEFKLQTYKSQTFKFCTSIYPKIKPCIKSNVTCQELVKPVINNCLAEHTSIADNPLKLRVANELYQEITTCVESNIFSYIQENNLRNTLKCRTRFK